MAGTVNPIPMKPGKSIIVAALVTQLLAACGRNSYLDYALKAAGENRAELESVLEHYRNEPEKLSAARFLIENMPAHTSYDCPGIREYYRLAERLFQSGLTPDEQADSLRKWSDDNLPDLEECSVPDVKVMTAGFLIYSIDHAFDVWKNSPWARDIPYDDFLEWLLPYKAVEKQEFDAWRDTLSSCFSERMKADIPDDVEYNTIFKNVDIVRNELIDKIHMHGIYDHGGAPVLSASGIAHQTFGRCADYVTLAVLTYRSLGLPAVMEEVPFWGRFRAGHTWYAILGDRGQELRAEWDLGSVPGWGFFPYERIPKAYRNTYAVNRRMVRYMNDAKYRYHFNLCQKDITSQLTKTADPVIPITKGGRLKDKYVYISIFNGYFTDWSIVDWGMARFGKARFRDMGVNVLYCVFGVTENGYEALCDPFILRKDGTVGYIVPDHGNLRTVEVRRKYPQSTNVVNMRRRLLGGRIECADRPDFTDARTLSVIDTVIIPDRIGIVSGPHRYWRYRGADGTYGSLSELTFFLNDSTVMGGRAVCCGDVPEEVARLAFDGDRLTNFESGNPDGAWVGADAGSPVRVTSVRIVPRSDDNDICPGDEYEFKYWDGDVWVSSGRFTATDNVLRFDSVPSGTLMWMRDYTRGWDERPFMTDGSGNVEWW